MGFLKELFEKKVKGAGQLGQLDIDGVHQSASSAYSLGSAVSDLRSPGAKLHPDKIKSLSACKADVHGTDADWQLAHAHPSSKSFSHAQHQHESPPGTSRLHKAVVRYESISQFSQRVEIYRGSVSTVFKAVCTASGTKVVIKAYHKARMQPKHHHKLAREVATMRVLSGAWVAELIASFEDSGAMYLVMELCEGGDLFRAMLMRGGSLEEHWVCVEVITPLLRIIEKMHALNLLHRDIKPENIFLTGAGKFRLGDFGLAINAAKELPFSRSGTLDYMAPEVLKNPSVPLQEGPSVGVDTLLSRGVKPYTGAVDVWAAGVLAYELVCGRPPFEVDDEGQTAALIMYSDALSFPRDKSQQWADFVRCALIKAPEQRPNAAALLQHPWVQTNIQQAVSERMRPSKDLLLHPLPIGCAPRYTCELERSMSLQWRAPAASAAAGPSTPSPMAGCLPPISPTAPKQAPALPVLHHQPGHHQRGAAHAVEAAATSVAHSRTDGARGAPHRDPGASPPASPKLPSPAAKLGLRPLQLQAEGAQATEPSEGSFDDSPSTPMAKPGIKERVKCYFQRQAGGSSGF